MPRLLAPLALTAALAAVAPTLPAADGDWPGWRGPDRTDRSPETGLLKSWPKEGPKLLWKATGLGGGYSTPSIAAGRIYLLGAQGKDEYLIALDAKDGSRVWATRIGLEAGGKPAPRSTPTIDGSLAYVISSDGKLVCADTGSGKVRWQKDLKADFGGRSGGWAYAESPLVDGDALVCTPGGKTATVVKLNKATGELLWKAPVAGLNAAKGEYTTAGYSSPVSAEIGGVRQYVQFISGGVVGVAARDGKLLWHYDHPANTTANCSTPIVRGDAVFAASAYGNGGGRADVTKDGGAFKATEAYFVKAMQNHHGGMVLVGDHVYGTGSGTLLCVDFRSGKVAWNERSVGKGSVTYADGRLYVRGENGPVALVEATPEGYKETGRFSPPERSKEPAWPHPVVAGGRLYLRDWDVLLCYDVKDMTARR
jgi:outer membrane protein assembly factor BamB